MSAEIVNLRHHRKRRDRAAKEREAASNRAKYGRPKDAVRREEHEKNAADRHHRDHLLDTKTDMTTGVQEDKAD